MVSRAHSKETDFIKLLSTKPWRESSMENTTSISNSTEYSSDEPKLTFIKAFELMQSWNLENILSIVYISGAMANGLLLSYLIYYKRYKSSMFCVILSLCISDLGVCLASLVWIRLYPIMVVPTWTCKPTILVLQISFLSSSYHIVLFAALRFFQLVYPLASRARVTVSLLSKVCLSIWAANFIQVFINFSFFEAVEIEYLDESLYYCLFTGNRAIFNMWRVITWAALPFLTTAGLHFSKHLILLCKRSDMVAMPSSSSSIIAQQGRKQTDTRALALVLILYLMSILPAIVQYVRYSFFDISSSAIEWAMTHVFEIMSFINSAINPWIYMFAAESVRSDIRKMCVGSK